MLGRRIGGLDVEGLTDSSGEYEGIPTNEPEWPHGRMHCGMDPGGWATIKICQCRSSRDHQ